MRNLLRSLFRNMVTYWTECASLNLPYINISFNFKVMYPSLELFYDGTARQQQLHYTEDATRLLYAEYRTASQVTQSPTLNMDKLRYK